MREVLFQTYAAAKEYLARGRDKDCRKCGHRTIVRKLDDGSIEVVYHSTAVVTYLPDGRVELRTGGWHSHTTAQRMRDYSLVGVSRVRGQIMVRCGAALIPLQEGMTVDFAGNLIPGQAALRRVDLTPIAREAVWNRDSIGLREAKWLNLSLAELAEGRITRLPDAEADCYSSRHNGFVACQQFLRASAAGIRPAVNSRAILMILNGHPTRAAGMHFLRVVRTYRRARAEQKSARYARLLARMLKVQD